MVDLQRPKIAGSETFPASVSVRALQAPDEFRACQDLQRRAWGIVEDGYVAPVATMIAAQKLGGLVLGAFHADRLVGFSFAFLGRLDGELVLNSQLTAVDPLLQSSGVGRLLKMEQRRQAAEMGLTSVVWTFDPLQAKNATFNLGVLGARCRRYEVDMYGTRTDELNRGLSTDRVFAEWPTRGATGGVRARWDDGVDLVTLERRRGASTEPRVLHVPAAARRAHVEIPADVNALKAASPDLALAWQLAVRQALRSAFEGGLVAVGFARGDRPCYLLERP